MKRRFYDLHAHSCLSPCGDEDMTVNNIAGMALIKGLDIVALTDHNSCKNCPAFFTACAKYGITPVAGMELTTAEEIHVICLFEKLEAALEFGKEVEARLPDIKNNERIFGQQIILDGEDNAVGKEEKLLSIAASIPIDRAVLMVGRYEGICYPAHIEREANGIISILGTFPPKPEFDFYELRDKSKKEELIEKYPVLSAKRCLPGSDAHFLWDISEAVNFIELPPANDPEALRRELFSCLRGA